MLHALGITHVVSVGECALVPPVGVPQHQENGHGIASASAPEYQVVFGSTAHRGSLWREEKEGRIKVLDIKVHFLHMLAWGLVLIFLFLGCMRRWNR